MEMPLRAALPTFVWSRLKFYYEYDLAVYSPRKLVFLVDSAAPHPAVATLIKIEPAGLFVPHAAPLSD